jgi:hypothetical protein
LARSATSPAASPAVSAAAPSTAITVASVATATPTSTPAYGDIRARDHTGLDMPVTPSPITVPSVRLCSGGSCGQSERIHADQDECRQATEHEPDGRRHNASHITFLFPSLATKSRMNSALAFEHTTRRAERNELARCSFSRGYLYTS